MGKFTIFVATLAGLVWSSGAIAATVTVYTDRALYEAAVAADPKLNTVAVPLSPFSNPPALDITSSSGMASVNVTALGGVPYLSNQHNVATDSLDMAPAADVRAIGFDYFLGNPGGIAGTLIGQLSVNGSLAATTINSGALPSVAFFGLISDSAITAVVLARTATGGFQANQVEFIKAISFSTVAATPLPPALPLFASGLGGLGLLVRRRRKAAAPSCFCLRSSLLAPERNL